MQTITLQPGEELRVTCAAPSGTASGAAAGNARNSNVPRNNTNGAQAPQSANSGGIAGFIKGITGGKRNKTRKAQKGGKRGPNGYMKFAKEMRPKVLKENPSMRSNVVAVAKKIGEAWRALPESERKKY